MLESVRIVLSYSEKNIPEFPGFQNANEVRALLAIHLEKTLFEDKDFIENSKKIFVELSISEKRAIFLLDIYESTKDILEILLKKLNVKKNAPTVGTFEYPAKDYIYLDEEDYAWQVDLKKLQEFEAQYDDIDLETGKLILFFNPREKYPRIVVDTRDIAIRVADDTGGINGMLQKLQQAIVGGQGSTCTCGNIPCTCGAAAANPQKDADYTEWDKLMQKASDSEVILVYQDGEELLRF